MANIGDGVAEACKFFWIIKKIDFSKSWYLKKKWKFKWFVF